MIGSGAEERWQEIREIWRQNQWLYVLSGIFIGLLINPFLDADKRVLLEGIIPEAVGILFTVLVLNRFAKQREEARFKADLIHRMGSGVNNEARRAVEELRRHGWLNDGSLRGIDLQRADLQDADLSGADLKGANLHGANLKEARLGWANLQKANLNSTNLLGANLEVIQAFRAYQRAG